MSTMTASMAVFHSLACRPSRASAAAIGHTYVLNGASPATQIRALSALGEMVCDWSLAILDQTVGNTRQRYLVRRYALSRICELLRRAVDRGYSLVDEAETRRLESEAALAIQKPPRPGDPDEIEAVEELCNHLGQAIADGVFEELPDF